MLAVLMALLLTSAILLVLGTCPSVDPHAWQSMSQRLFVDLNSQGLGASGAAAFWQRAQLPFHSP